MSESMKLSEYFEKAQGIGVLLPIDASGQVNQAIYGRPHFPDDDDATCLFITSNRLSHDNVKHNQSASYLFIEEAEGYVGKQLSLTVIEDETDPEKVKAICCRNVLPVTEKDGQHIVHCHIENVLSLIGNE